MSGGRRDASRSTAAGIASTRRRGLERSASEREREAERELAALLLRAGGRLVPEGDTKGHYPGCRLAVEMKPGERAWTLLGEWPPKERR